MAHLSDRDVEGFLAGGLTGNDLHRVTRHLLAGCQDCRARLAAATVQSKAESDDVYDACIDRARRTMRRLRSRLKRDEERREAGVALLRERWFGELTWPERRSFWEVHVEVLLDLSFEARYRDPLKMLELARTAQEIADRPGKARYGEALHVDLRTRAWAELGNAWRVNEDFDKAEAALQNARTLLDEGTGDPLLEIRIDDFEASLRKAQRRFDEAINLLNKVHRSYMRLGERHLAGRALMSKGINLELSGRPDEAIRSLQRAIDLIDGERDPQLVASAHHSLLKTLVDCGKFHEAGRLLLQSGLRQKFAGDPLNLLRLRWVEAKILAGHGRLEDAQEVLWAVYLEFHKRGLDYVAAVAGLDLAEVMLRQDKKTEAHCLAVDLYNTFQEQKIDVEAQRALMTFEVVCGYQSATPEMARRMRDFLDRRQHNRTLRFEPLQVLYG